MDESCLDVCIIHLLLFLNNISESNWRRKWKHEPVWGVNYVKLVVTLGPDIRLYLIKSDPDGEDSWTLMPNKQELGSFMKSLKDFNVLHGVYSQGSVVFELDQDQGCVGTRALGCLSRGDSFAVETRAAW